MKVGDKVRIKYCETMPRCSCNGKYDGLESRIRKGKEGCWYLEKITDTHYWNENELEVIEQEIDMSKKYYRVVKEHPVWEKDAIIENAGNGGQYETVDDVFCKDICDEQDLHFYEDSRVVEHSDWFERVYPIGKLEKLMFGTKKQAQAAAAALYKGAK